MKSLKNSVSFKIAAVFMSVIVSISVLAVIVTYYSIHLLEKQALLSNQTNLDYFISQMDSELTVVNRTMYEVANDSVSFDILDNGSEGNEHTLAKADVSKTFQRDLAADHNISGLMLLIPDNKETVLISSFTEYEKREQIIDFVSSGLFNRDITTWQLEKIGNVNYLIRFISYHHASIAAIVDLDSYAKNYKFLNIYKDTIIEFSSKATGNQKAGYISESSDSQNGDIRVISHILASEVYRSLPIIHWISLVIFLGSLFSFPLLMRLLRDWLVRPLQDLDSAMKQIETGNMNYQIPENRSSDEFRKIDHTFNRMSQEIEQLKIANYEQKLETTRYEFHILQLKINPHFLLNSFNLLYSLAQLKDFQKIQNLCNFLMEYFRHIFKSNTDYVSLDDELALVKSYLNISNIHYQNSFSVQYDVEPGLLKMDVLPLIIENFVENCVKYAIVMGEHCDILISAKSLDAGTAEIIVRDTGQGMPPEKLAEINASLRGSVMPEKHTGIYCSYKRLLYYYKENADFRIESSCDAGTCVTMHFPKARSRKNV